MQQKTYTNVILEIQTLLEWIVLSAAHLSVMEMKLNREQSGGSLSSPRWPLTIYITLGNHTLSLCFCASLFALPVWNGKF